MITCCCKWPIIGGGCARRTGHLRQHSITLYKGPCLMEVVLRAAGVTHGLKMEPLTLLAQRGWDHDMLSISIRLVPICCGPGTVQYHCLIGFLFLRKTVFDYGRFCKGENRFHSDYVCIRNFAWTHPTYIPVMEVWFWWRWPSVLQICSMPNMQKSSL